MNIENSIFAKYTPIIKKLKEYGFLKKGDYHFFEKSFLNDEFKAIISISKSGEITGIVYDNENNEEFLPLRIEGQQGAFIGEIRSAYENILLDIRNKCFEENAFISEQANRITKLIFTKYGDKPEFLWEKFQGFGVFRNPDSGKWYGLISNINANKIDKNRNEEIEILNIKADENEIPKLHKIKGFYPAYHMNKKSWITIILDNSVKDEAIIGLIEKSHIYTENNKSSEWIIPANPKYFNLEEAFNNNSEILWKQSSNIKKNHIVYMYVAAPYSAILYKCKLVEANIPYDYKDKNISINTVMKIKLLKKYDKTFMPFSKLKKYGINAIRGQRRCPKNISTELNC